MYSKDHSKPNSFKASSTSPTTLGYFDAMSRIGSIMTPTFSLLAYEEQLLDRRYWKELQSNSRELLSLKSSYENVVRDKELVEAEVAKVKVVAAAERAKIKDETGRLIREAEEKAKTAVASETARLHLEFDKRWEAHGRKERQEAVMAYRRDRGRVVEQATAYVDGGKYILGKIKEAFPSQDWSLLPEPEVTESEQSNPASTKQTRSSNYSL